MTYRHFRWSGTTADATKVKHLGTCPESSEQVFAARVVKRDIGEEVHFIVNALVLHNLI